MGRIIGGPYARVLLPGTRNSSLLTGTAMSSPSPRFLQMGIHPAGADWKRPPHPHGVARPVFCAHADVAMKMARSVRVGTAAMETDGETIHIAATATSMGGSAITMARWAVSVSMP